MLLNFNAFAVPPRQPIDDPTGFPAYAPGPGRKRMDDTDWRVASGVSDEDWDELRLQTAIMYAKEDAAADLEAQAATKRMGRPPLYPFVDGETKEDRRKRLGAERAARHRRLKAVPDEVKAEFLDRVVKQRHAVATAEQYAREMRQQLNEMLAQVKAMGVEPAQGSAHEQ